MNKWYFIMLSIIAGFGMTAISVREYSESNISQKAIENGLEECPNLTSISSNETIWVKSCTEYTNNYYKHEG